ncbi:MAG: FGGY family carbohydrate kinase [Bryobacteraceae bacterium]|nr:FGGY family carbohydrate kinase [Bryobacteraceae bacterium]MDW8377005.1 FGGY family carbohydrate kinase [Bryobacterales bacterium]
MILGLDLGSSFLKAALLDVQQFRIVEAHRLPFPDFEPDLPPSHREVQVSAILERVRALLDLLGPGAPSIQALMVSGQMHGFVCLDSEARAVSNYISWLDHRALPDVVHVRERLGEDVLQALGNELRPGVALATLASLRWNGCLSGASVCSLGAYVVSQLCQSKPVEEPTYAASLGALDLRSFRWHEEALSALGLETLAWPEIRSWRKPAGWWRGVPVYPAVGDQQCSLAGALLSEGELSINVSTGSQVACLAPGLLSGRFQNRPYFDGWFLRTITHLPAGRSLDRLLGLLAEMGADRDPWRYALESAAQVRATDLQANLCFFPGPLGSRGAFTGLTEANLTVGHLFRAAFESMAGNYYQAAGWLDREHFSRMVFSGGLVQKSPLLRDIIVQKFGLPWRTSPTEEDGMMGLLLLGAVACGQFDSLEEATKAAREMLAPAEEG